MIQGKAPNSYWNWLSYRQDWPSSFWITASNRGTANLNLYLSYQMDGGVQLQFIFLFWFAPTYIVTPFQDLGRAWDDCVQSERSCLKQPYHNQTLAATSSFLGPQSRSFAVSWCQKRYNINDVNKDNAAFHYRAEVLCPQEEKPSSWWIVTSIPVPEGAPRGLDFRQGPGVTGQRGMASHCQKGV